MGKNKRVILKVAKLMTCGVLLIMLPFVYWQILAAPRLNENPGNPRHTAHRLRVQRGGIYARGGEVIARSNREGEVYLRDYPVLLPGLAPTIGYFSSRYGLSGLEASLNQELSGAKEQQTLRGWWRAEALGESLPGQDVYTTIDLGIQAAAEAALGGRAGAVVALAPETGEILAMVSGPGFDLRQVDKTWEDLVEHPDSPFLNRPIQGLYPPGSAFKILILAAALESGAIGFGYTFNDQGKITVSGHEIENYGGKAYGHLDLYSALAVSSNVAFVEIGQKLGEEGLRSAAEGFGIGRDLNLRLPYRSGRLAPDKMSPTELAEESIGQGKLLVTPLEMALITAVIANQGGLPEPILVKAIRDSAGNLVYFHRPKMIGYPISRQVANFVREAMVKVVKDGTGKAAAVPNLEVAGKTGTAENPHGRSHGWFVGFAPAMIRDFGSGDCGKWGRRGTVAAPIARRVIEAALSSSH